MIQELRQISKTTRLALCKPVKSSKPVSSPNEAEMQGSIRRGLLERGQNLTQAIFHMNLTPQTSPCPSIY